jgi:hypothetical protein
MTHLSQIVAIVGGTKSRATATFIQLSKDVAKAVLTEGLNKSYQPREEGGETYPTDNKEVQLTVDGVLARISEVLTRMFDVVYTQEAANTEAKADVSVNGDVLLSAVPLTYLLFLEKQLALLREVVRDDLPVLDPAQKWTPDTAGNAGVWRSEPIKSIKGKKVPKVVELAAPTKEHPAQVHLLQEDIVEGEWTTVRFSGAIPGRRRQELLDRVDTLADAVKMAREEANRLEVTDRQAGAVVFGYLFGTS